MSLFTPYQVDFSVKNTSKTFGFSKKRVSFKFGIANNQAVAQGLTGANCRGSEHEVIFIWSLNSGKRQILADANRDMPSVRPFDLRVNGISFFSFSKIFQLGTPNMVSKPIKGSRSVSGAEDDDPYITPEERKAIAAAKLASIRDLREKEASRSGAGGGAGSVVSAPPVMSRNEGNLINLLDDPTPTPAPPPPNLDRGQQKFASSISMDTALWDQPQSSMPPAPAPAPYGQQPYSNYSLNIQQPPPPQQYQQPPPPPNMYGQPPQAQPGYGQTSLYGQPPPLQQQSSFGQASPFGPTSPTNSMGFAQPSPSNSLTQAYQQPPPPVGQPQPYYQTSTTTPQYQQGYGSPPPGNSMMSPGAQTVASYGSAPQFAQPPRPNQGYPGY